MNRTERRKRTRDLSKFQKSKTSTPGPTQDIQPDFSQVPLTTVCESIWMLIRELRNRGYPVYDWDHKDKSVQGIKIIRNKIYFLIAEEANNGKEQTKKENRKQTHE